MVDPYDLQRFVRAQEHDYEEALSEIRSGRKRSHWMWYIFPQFDGLGSANSKRYAVKSVAEARAFLAHPLLGPRLRECAAAAVRIEGPFRRGHLRLSGRHEAAITARRLFARGCPPAGSVFQRINRQVFSHGEPDG
jgi:uncharacterized protein (DUF1810 family)